MPRGTNSDGAYRGTDSDGAYLTARALANSARQGTNVEQATPGNARSRAENRRSGPTGRTRASDSQAGTLAEPLRAPRTLEVSCEPSPAGAGRRPEQPEGSERFAWLGSLSTSGGSRARHPAQAEFQSDDSH